MNKFTGIDWSDAASGAASELVKMHETRWRMIRRFLTQKYRLDYDCRLDKRPASLNSEEGPFTVLDVGCGGGLLTASMAQLGAKVTAVDPVADNLEQSRRRVEALGVGEKVEFKECTIEDVVKEGRSFDIVCSLEVVEHVANPNFFLRSCAQLVKSGGEGTLVLSTINRTIKSYLLAIVAAE